MKNSRLNRNSRIWIYTASRKLNTDEVNWIEKKGLEFTDSWQTHGKPLEATIEVVYNRFIVVAVDDEWVGPSGCSIDSSIAFIKEMESSLQIDLLDKLNIAYRNRNGAIDVVKLPEFQTLIDQGEIKSDTLVFNNLIQKLNQLDDEWEVELDNSWHKQLLPA
ncbi:MAG TPA: ABC transporter ATPase [Flavobacteriales bacterium]|jgi:hypothetical protein|nr:ABC transporter ATPase [Flavobacteriales bacterium]